MNPQSGREQAGRRPAVCLSPAGYNWKVGLAVFCPITSRVKGYPFEVAIDPSSGIKGVALADQLKSLDWRERRFEFVAEASESELREIVARAAALIGR
jgi:mRNA interferase MazF